MIVEYLSCRKTLLWSWNCNNPSTPTKPQWHPLMVTCSYRTRFNALRYGACELHCVFHLLSSLSAQIYRNLIQYKASSFNMTTLDLHWTPYPSVSHGPACSKIPTQSLCWSFLSGTINWLDFPIEWLYATTLRLKVDFQLVALEGHGVKSGCQG